MFRIPVAILAKLSKELRSQRPIHAGPGSDLYRVDARLYLTEEELQYLKDTEAFQRDF